MNSKIFDGFKELIRTLVAPLQLFALLDNPIFKKKRYAFNYYLTAQKLALFKGVEKFLNGKR